MEELWTVRCFEGTEEKWTEDVRLSNQDMRTLLQLLLCRKLTYHEIIASVEGRRDLLAVRQDDNGMHTVDGLLHYTARKGDYIRK